MPRLTKEMVRKIQLRLTKLGFGNLTVDGVRGRNTDNAIIAFKKSVGLRARPFIGPLTWKALFPEEQVPVIVDGVSDVPWMDEALRMKGLHEQRDRKRLMEFLGFKGRTIGDPAKVPWCGDFVETCIAKALPHESVPANPFLAANWVNWGKECNPQYGAILSFWRGSPSSWKGHIGFYYAEDSSAYHVLGGNQSNSVSIARIAKNRLRPHGCRWPLTAMEGKDVRNRVGGNSPLSTNEA